MADDRASQPARPCRAIALLCAALWCLALAPIGMGSSARAQQGGATATSYITPFPENDSYRLEVWGDVLAEGLLAGLVDQFADEPRVAVERRHRAIASLMRPTFDDDIGEIVSEIARTTAHIIVIQLGLNDRVPLRLPNGRRAAVGSEPWREEYSRRIDRIMRAFKAQRIAAYWVGLPIMRRPDANDDAQAINELLRERANVAGLKMIDVYAATADAGGNYDAYGPDVSGTNRLLRHGDGITFTAAGNRKLAHFVERELKRDLVQARAQRSIPLAGSETEQRQIRPHRQAPPVTARAPADAGLKPVATARPTATTTEGELKADNSRITLTAGTETGRQETATVDLPRPAISGNLMALLARRAASDRTNQPGEVLVREIPGGLTLSRTISTTGSPGAPQRRALPSQTPFFRVLVKGERLEPKVGRADDIVWPPAAAAAPSAAPAAAAPATAPARATRQPVPRPATR